MALEDLLESVGSFGRFQVMTIMILQSYISTISYSMLMMTFGGLEPDWWCITERHNITMLNASSPSYQHCDSNSSDSCYRVYEFNKRTVVSEMSGILVGAFVGGLLGDSIGRKKTWFLAVCLHGIFNLAIAFSNTWQMFAVFRCFIGFSLGCYLIVYLYGVEFVSPKRRSFTYIIAQMAWPIGVCMLSLAAYLIHDWRYLHIVCAVTTIPYLSAWCLVPESARWLATKNRIEEARAVIEKIAAMNGTTVPDDCDTMLRKVAELEQGGQRYTYIDLIKDCNMLKNTICLGIIWMVYACVYYGVQFGVSNFSGDFYLNLFLMNVIEIPIYTPQYFVLGRFGRKVATAVPHLVAAGLAICVIIIQEVMDTDKSSGITALAMIIQVLISAAWYGVALLTGEAYPTVVRNLGNGSANTLARIGGMIAPFIFNLGGYRYIPYVILAVMLSCSSIAFLILPETLNKELTDAMSEEKGTLDKSKKESK